MSGAELSIEEQVSRGFHWLIAAGEMPIRIEFTTEGYRKARLESNTSILFSSLVYNAAISDTYMGIEYRIVPDSDLPGGQVYLLSQEELERQKPKPAPPSAYTKEILGCFERGLRNYLDYKPIEPFFLACVPHSPAAIRDWRQVLSNYG